MANVQGLWSKLSRAKNSLPSALPMTRKLVEDPSQAIDRRRGPSNTPPTSSGENLSAITEPERPQLDDGKRT